MRCTNCGTENDSQNKFCISCGLALTEEKVLPQKGKPYIWIITGVGILFLLLLFWFLFLNPKQSQTGGLEINNTITPQVTLQAQLSEPAGKIVFTCQVDRKVNHDQICIINPDGSGFKQLTNDLKREHYYASLSPDVQTIFYSGSAGAGIFEIFELDLNGNIHQLTNLKQQLYSPELSPDGSKIVFTRHIDAYNQYISVMDRDGSNIRDLTYLEDCRDPIWSPNGSEILFTSRVDGSYQIFTMSSTGTNVRKITDMFGLRGRTDWYDDGTIATYAGEVDLHNREIYTFKAGQTPVAITSSGDNLAPSFSPDGQWMAFMSYRAEKWYSDGCEIYIMRRDGSDVRRLTSNNYCDYQPRWGK